MDQVLTAVRNQGVPAMQALPGCGRIEILVDDRSRTILYVSEWTSFAEAEGATNAKYRLEALARVEPYLTSPAETVVFESVLSA
jgi:quinol monooxygenase YgiN